MLLFFNKPAATEIYTLSLHDALPICTGSHARQSAEAVPVDESLGTPRPDPSRGDRKSTRLNSSHVAISYAVFCLKKKKQTTHKEVLHRALLPAPLQSAIVCASSKHTP